MKKINFAVLGAHNRGKISQLAHRPENGLRLIAACGRSLDHLEDYRAICGPDILLTKDYRDIIFHPKIDAIFICTPDFLHAEHTLAALAAGKHVYLEKPMAITIEDCDAILRADGKNGGRLYVGHNMRFFPVMQKMHNLIREGRIGRVEAIWCRHFISYGGDAYYKDWHSERRNSTGLLLQKGAHDIDILHWLAGSYTRRVVGMGKLSVYNEVEDRRHFDEVSSVAFNPENWPPLKQKGLSPDIDVEDHSMLLLQMENGVQASYSQCHYTPDSGRNYTIIGTEGRIENLGDHSTREQWASVHLWNSRMGHRCDQGNEIFRIPHLQGSHGGADPLIVDDFIKFLRGGEPAGAKPLDARMAVAAGCQGTASLRGGSIPLDIPPA